MRHSLAFAFLLPALMALPACRADETVRGYGGEDREWILQEIDGARFNARATITFPEAGQIAGEAPCNRYFGEMNAPYPWFDASKVASTRRACPELDAEQRFLGALSAMTQSEVLGDVLILRNDEGREMVFKAE